MKKVLFLLLAISALLLAGQELEIEIQVNSVMELDNARLSGLMLDNYDPSTNLARGVIREENLSFLDRLGFSYEILPETDSRVLAAMRKEPSGYPMHYEYLNFMANVVSAHSSLASLDTIGYSDLGKPILMMKLSQRVAWDEPEPEFCYFSTMHGDEPVGTIFLMWFIDSLTDNYGSDPRVTRLLDSCEIFINPLLNPDGYVAMERENNSGIDLNRNFPVPDGDIGDDATFTTEAETDVVMDWCPKHNISYTINYHTGALLANYPWDYKDPLSPDDSLYKFISINYSSRNIPMYTNPSVSGATNGIIHGYDWYPVDGSIQDWTYWICGDLHITVELRGYPKTPPFSSLDTLWEHNYDAHLAAIEVCLNHGVNGLVADSISGSPLGASVAIDDPDVEIHSDSINGYYHRILLPGDYNLTFSKSGYHSKTLSVTVPDTGLAILNAELAPLGRGDLNGHVWLGDETDYSGVNIIAVSPSASAETTITDVSGYYEFTGLIPASDYIITASKLGFQDSSQTLDIAEYGSYTVDFTLYPLNYIYFSDFETDDGGLHTPDLGDSQDWEWGTPISGPSSSHSGTKLWGTLLDSDYNNSSKSRLILEDIDLPAGTSSQLTLSFWQWYSFQPPTSSGWPSYVNSWHDGGNIKLWLSTTDSLILHPNPDYDTTMSEWNQLIPEQRAYADQENGNFWHKVQIDLDDWAGNTVDISWDFGSSLSNVEAGWFIDDVAIYYTDYTAVEIDNSGTLPEATSIIISPNPFNNGCKIRVRNIRDSKLPLEIYSIRGKLIKSVEISKKDEYTTWNGEDLAGNSVASGIYLVRYGDKVLGRAIFIK